MIFEKKYISPGSVATHLRCGRAFSNRVVANVIQNVPVKKNCKDQLIRVFGEDMDSDKVGRL